MGSYHIINIGIYSLLINNGLRTIEIYNPVCREEILNSSSLGIKWENLELILNCDDKRLIKDLARRIIETCEKP